MKRLALFCLISVWVSGCATSPVALTDAKPVPADRIYAYRQPVNGASGTLVVVRDEGFQSKGCPVAFYIDGTLAAHVRAGETVTLTVPVGNRILGIGPAGKGLCSLADEATHRRETSLAVDSGSQTKVRVAVVGEGFYQVTPTAF